MTKKQKLAKLHSLIQQVHPGSKPQDVSKVYKIEMELSKQWVDLLVEEDLDTWPLEHVAQMQLNTSYADDACWTEAPPVDLLWSSPTILLCSDVVALLDDMKAELGPDPANTCILWGEDNSMELVTAKDSTVKELDQYIDKMEGYLESKRHLDQTTSGTAAQTAKVAELVKQLGHAEVIELLGQAVKDQHD